MNSAAKTPLYYVSRVGHQWAMCPVDFSNKEKAIEYARNTCSNAMRTDVWDCTDSPVGTLVLSLGRNGQPV